MSYFKVSRSHNVATVALLALVGFASGCATRGYVRSQVSNSAQQLNAKMDQGDTTLQQGISANSSQIQELTTVSQQNTQQIQTLDSGLKQTDAKVTQTASALEATKGTADRANASVAALDAKFQNRNRYNSVSQGNVQFRTGSASLEDTSKENLNQVVQQVKGNPDAILMMEGHTDSTGDEAANQRLAERRLDSIIHYLVTEQSVPVYVIYKISYGEEQPIAPNDTPEGREQNRAVVIHVMAPEARTAAMR